MSDLITLSKYCSNHGLPYKSTKCILIEKGWLSNDNKITTLGQSFGLTYSQNIHGTYIYFPTNKLDDFIANYKNEIIQHRAKEYGGTELLPAYPNRPRNAVTPKIFKYAKLAVLSIISTSAYTKNNERVFSIVETSILNMDGTERFHDLIKPLTPLSEYTMASSCFTDDMFAHLPDDTWINFVDALDSNTIYIVNRDLTSLLESNAKLRNYGLEKIQSLKFICTNEISESLFQVKNCGFEKIAKTLGVQTYNGRRSSYDGLITLNVFEKLDDILSNVKHLPPVYPYELDKNETDILDLIKQGITDTLQITNSLNLYRSTVETKIITLVKRGLVDPSLYIDIDDERKILNAIKNAGKWTGKPFRVGELSYFQFQITMADPRTRVFICQKLINRA